ncbi:hypothetical protein RHMOL_Rhmol06G0277700 [Rhododendron molle]|uniref:Uncharacterized protein n=1 Tax=Rhododendron molle TaxID=49168 RepID=A0ACC0NGV5_RHOML|nr:hypothetical protein RHMOL_Rhmol06G0277700 [Rhododendron molle]
MSDKCSDCNCSDSSKCTKKGNTIVIETEKSYIETFVVDAPAAENDGKCKCAVNVDDGVAMAAMVFRDHQGKILDGDVGRVHEKSVLQGEFAAIRLACVMAKEKRFFECIL